METCRCPLLPQSLTVASRLLEGRSRVREFGGGRPRGDGRIRVQALGHLVADEVDEALEGLLHVDVVLGAGLEELKTFWGGGRGAAGRQSQPRDASLSCVAAAFGMESCNSQFQFYRSEKERRRSRYSVINLILPSV